MRILETKVYSFEELEDDAKERAREEYRTAAVEYGWWDCVYDEASQIGAILGFKVSDIWFSGFYSQGDGACFEGYYEYAPGWRKSLKQYAPLDKELEEIGLGLQEIQRKYFYKLSAATVHSGYYYHSGCMSVTVDDDERYHPQKDAEEEVTQYCRFFADWIYKRLEDESEWLMSDEVIDESLTINEYEFTEEGRMA